MIFRRHKARQAHAKAVEAVHQAKARKDTRALHAATLEAHKALHARLRAGA